MEDELPAEEIARVERALVDEMTALGYSLTQNM
jgi:hypothetical protein